MIENETDTDAGKEIHETPRFRERHLDCRVELIIATKFAHAEPEGIGIDTKLL